MRNVILAAAAIFCAAMANAQAGIDFDLNSPGVGGLGTINFTNAGLIGTKSTTEINDADITGSPNFDERWNPALLVLKNNTAVKLKKVKLNLYKSEVHYIDTLGMELVAAAGTIKKIFFFDGRDTSKVTAVFQQITGVDGKGGSQFIQVLNSGNTELLKFNHVVINDKGFDPSVGKNNYNFATKPLYYLLYNGAVTPLATLGKDAVLGIIPPSAGIGNWLDANHNKLKNENDIVSFLNYYNSGAH